MRSVNLTLVTVAFACVSFNLENLSAQNVGAIVESLQRDLESERRLYEKRKLDAEQAAVRKLKSVARRGSPADASIAYRQILKLDRDDVQARSFFEGIGQLEQILLQLDQAEQDRARSSTKSPAKGQTPESPLRHVTGNWGGQFERGFEM